MSLWHLLDDDGSGVIDVEEFCFGALKLSGPARCLDMVKVQGNFIKLQQQLETIVSVVADTSGAQR